MSFTLNPLPYEMNALQPFISVNTMEHHYKQHHNAYVNNLNTLIEGTLHSKQTLEEIIKLSYNDSGKVAMFNNAAQVWNHDFYWKSMKKGGGNKPDKALLSYIETSFGTYESFYNSFKESGRKQFGSGWVWLIYDKTIKKLKIESTSNAYTPIVNEDTIPIIVMDVWEHAYYLDYQHKRQDYMSTFLNNLVNWEFAQQNLIKAI